MSDQGFDDNNLEFGEAGAEECGVEGDREMTSSAPSSERIKEMPIDRLSELPDLLVIHILSFLGVKEAAVTSVLSKRWNGLWAELPGLEFWEDNWTKKANEFVSWVNRTLATRKGDYLEKFLVKFRNYDKSFASDVDAWVEYCVKNEARELSLMLYSLDYYRPPQMMYSCSSLTDLHLSGCTMASEGAIAWKSLTALSLDDVKLNQRLIDEILSSRCPVLKSLEIEGCWGFYRLEANSPCLDQLEVESSIDEDYLEISAPYVCKLDVTVTPGKWQLENILSVVDASINFCDFAGGLSEEVMSDAKEFLEKFKHVKNLWIKGNCLEVLSVMALNGRQLPQFRLQQLSLSCFSEYEHIISGVIAMLNSSPNIETLHLDGYDSEGIIFNMDPATKVDLDGDLLHLKKIGIENFADPNGEPLLTFARILLRRATVLEEMKIVIYGPDVNDYINIARTLLTYPRSSTIAKIHLF